ncbi:unnamed protein product [Symbiodinium sp. CCMP2456]|nr:unnamed protein product [Symbiodinium sp. CCMP2456]
MARSYYDALGQAQGVDFDFFDMGQDSEESQSFATPPPDAHRRWGRRGGAKPGTGGLSSSDRSGESAQEEFFRGHRPRRVFWDGWSEDGKWEGKETESRQGHDPSWHTAGGNEDAADENWSWKTGHSGKTGWSDSSWSRSNENWGWKSQVDNDSAWSEGYNVNFVEDEVGLDDYDTKNFDGKGKVKVAGAMGGDEEKSKPMGKVSSTYPPIFRAKPQESYVEWKRSVEFWIGSEAGQLPPEIIGPRIMVQLKDRAAQLVKHLSLADVNHKDGKSKIFEVLEQAPLIKQVERHRIDEHRRRLMQLNRAAGESMESYITRAGVYRSHLLGLDPSLAMGEAFYVGHLLDHAHLTRRDKVMIKTKAGNPNSETEITAAMMDLAAELEGESGYPVGIAEPSLARNGEEWLLQRSEGRQQRLPSGQPGGRTARSVFAAEGGNVEEPEFLVHEDGEESLEEGDIPPEIMHMENEAFGTQYKARQKIAEVRKLRQYYKKPEQNEERRRLLQEKMKTNPCHACGQLGHWSRECPNPNGGGKPQGVLAARAAVPSKEATSLTDGAEWALLASVCGSSKGSTDVPRPSRASPQYTVHQVYSSVSVALHEVCWSLKELVYKVILDIGCMRSVAGVHWANALVKRWQGEGRWFRVTPEVEVFKFGDGEILKSRYRLSFLGSFGAKPVVYGFSIVDGVCPPLFSRAGCTQIGAVIDCEHHCVGARKLGVKSYGLGLDSGHYTMPVDECDPLCAALPEDFMLENGIDVTPVSPAVLKLEPPHDSPPRAREAHGLLGSRSSPEMQAVPGTSPDARLPDHCGDLRRQLRQGGHAGGSRGEGQRGTEEAGGPQTFDGSAGEDRTGDDEHRDSEQRADVLGISGDFDPGRDPDANQEAGTGGIGQIQGPGPQGPDRGAGGLPFVEPRLGQRGRAECGLLSAQQDEDLSVEEVRLAAEGQDGGGAGVREALEEKPAMAQSAAQQGDRLPLRPLWGDEAKAELSGDVAADVRAKEPRVHRPSRGVTQKLKAGVTAGKAALQVLSDVVVDKGQWILLEVFAGTGRLTQWAQHGGQWRAVARLDRDAGWDLTRREDGRKLLELVSQEKPDLVTLAPPCGAWSVRQDEGGRPETWEWRRQQLPLWQLVSEVWRVQNDGGRLVLTEQPVGSEALQLSMMQGRDSLFRVYLDLCAFGLIHPENGDPLQKRVVLDVNDKEFARELAKNSWCPHKHGGHLAVKGMCRVDGEALRLSDWAARWPDRFCVHVLRGAEAVLTKAWKDPVEDWSLSEPIPSSGCWEATVVTNASLPEEHLRKHMAENCLSGERYDFVSFEGASNQQPRRLRAMVAHLHVTLGHPSNERLARMLSVSGGRPEVVQLGRNLRCQVCAMVRPPQAMPQVAYSKPKQFNERISGDSFYIWDIEGVKYAVTHFIDGLTDYHVGDLTDRPDSGFSREVLQDLWLGPFGPPDLLITDGGPEFAGQIPILTDLFGMVHEIVPEGAKWRMGQAERHGAIVKLMMMRNVKAMALAGLKHMRLAALCAFSAKNRLSNKGGVSPMQAVTGRASVIPGSLMQQLAGGHLRFKHNQALETSEALAQAERIRHGAIESFHWLDSHEALRRALASRSRPPALEGLREGAVVYVYEPPVSRRGQARRLQDASSWQGPGVVVCVERDKPVPARIWVRIRGRVKAFPLEKLRLATPDEMMGAEYITHALQDVEDELKKGILTVDENGGVGGNAADEDAELATVINAPDRKKDRAPQGSSDSSSSSSSDVEVDERAEAKAQLLDDIPYCVRQNLKQKAEDAKQPQDPHEWDLAKKRRLFEKLSKQLEPPSTLEEAGIRDHLNNVYSKFKAVKRAIGVKPKGSATRSRASARGRNIDPMEVVQPQGVNMVEDLDLEAGMFKPGEYEAMLNDTIGQWTLWSSPSPHSGEQKLIEVTAALHEADKAGVTEVVTGKARVEYKWSGLDEQWRQAYVGPLKKALQVYLDHAGIKGVPKGTVVDPSRILSSRFVLTNKGGSELSEALLKARWIIGGHRDPDAGLYDTSSPTASTLGHGLLNFVAVQNKWVIHYEDVTAAFLQGKELPRTERIYARLPKGYPPEVVEFLVEALGGDVRDDLVEITKGGFGLPESPRLWYLAYKEVLQELGLHELRLAPGVFRAFTEAGGVRAMASIHVDDTRYAGDETSGVLWEQLHARLKFGEVRKATEGWQKFCGRWERQDPLTFELEVSMDSYITNIPLVKPKGNLLYIEFQLHYDDFGVRSQFRKGNLLYIEFQLHYDDSGEPPLTDQEKRVLSSVVGQLNWAARQARFDLCFGTSLVQQLAGQGRGEAMKWINTVIRRAKESVVLRVRNLGCSLEDVVVLSVSDAAYGAMPNGGSQGGTLVMFASPTVLEGVGPVCILEATSSKVQRIVRCSMSAEVSSLATAFEHGDYVRALFVELVKPTFSLKHWKASVAAWKHVLVTDARTGYDAINSETLPTDRKIAIDVGVLRQGLVEDSAGCQVRWVPGSQMPGDGLTKWHDNGVLLRIMTEGCWSLKDTAEAQELRRQAAAKRSAWRKSQKTNSI